MSYELSSAATMDPIISSSNSDSDKRRLYIFDIPRAMKVYNTRANSTSSNAFSSFTSSDNIDNSNNNIICEINNILVVDDVLSNRKMFQLLLMKRGFKNVISSIYVYIYD